MTYNKKTKEYEIGLGLKFSVHYSFNIDGSDSYTCLSNIPGIDYETIEADTEVLAVLAVTGLIQRSLTFTK